MRRVLVRAWGADGAQYVGKSVTLFLDEQVRSGGAAVGGIRISHLSYIEPVGPDRYARATKGIRCRCWRGRAGVGTGSPTDKY